MSILSKIFSKIFPSAHAATQNSTAANPSQTKAPQANPSGTNPSGTNPSGITPPLGTPASSQPSTNPQSASLNAPTTQPIGEVDVEIILNELAQKSGQSLNWRTSIVDLLKLLNLDSSLEARKELAQELQYNGDTNDSATMNIWLHKQVMNKLAANGGKVPAELKD